MSIESDKITDFESHWIRIAKDIETTEMSMDDVREWKNKFNIEKHILIQELTGQNYNSEVSTSIRRIKDKFGIAILKAKANYREREKIRLKDSYGFLAPLIYIIFKIFGKV